MVLPLLTIIRNWGATNQTLAIGDASMSRSTSWPNMWSSYVALFKP